MILIDSCPVRKKVLLETGVFFNTWSGSAACELTCPGSASGGSLTQRAPRPLKRTVHPTFETSSLKQPPITWLEAQVALCNPLAVVGSGRGNEFHAVFKIRCQSTPVQLAAFGANGRSGFWALSRPSVMHGWSARVLKATCALSCRQSSLVCTVLPFHCGVNITIF